MIRGIASLLVPFAVIALIDLDKIPGLGNALESHVVRLASTIGERSYKKPEKLAAAADYIESRFRECGCKTERQPFDFMGKTYENVICIVNGASGTDKALVIGAHYDTVWSTRGADDNASGVAVLIELARMAMENPYRLDAHFAAFSLEEPPAFGTEYMGSYAYARRLKDAGTILHGMAAIETVGYYCHNPGCQKYPLPGLGLIYPDKGDYIGIVGNFSSGELMKEIALGIKSSSGIPVETMGLGRLVPGTDLSDHRNFWLMDYKAVMITDTAFNRNPNYHGYSDEPATLDYETMARLALALDSTFRGIE